MARFKEAGVLDTLLGLAEPEPEDDPGAGTEPPAPAAKDDQQLIDAMDVADLVQRALGKTS
jgi:rifamycin polyketide synthase module 1/2/3